MKPDYLFILNELMNLVIEDNPQPPNWKSKVYCQSQIHH